MLFIELINLDQYKRLRKIQKDHPKLTFQNNGYEYIKKDTLSQDDLTAFKEVEDLLKERIAGFSEFNNFKLTDQNEVQLRFQYNYGAGGTGTYFIGVGYILLKELYQGFREFKLGDTITLDRYNHLDDAQKATVVGYGEMILSGKITYKLDVNGTIIESTGKSIMESALYEPVPEEDRHPKE